MNYDIKEKSKGIIKDKEGNFFDVVCNASLSPFIDDLRLGITALVFTVGFEIKVDINISPNKELNNRGIKLSRGYSNKGNNRGIRRVHDNDDYLYLKKLPDFEFSNREDTEFEVVEWSSPNDRDLTGKVWLVDIISDIVGTDMYDIEDRKFVFSKNHVEFEGYLRSKNAEIELTTDYSEAVIDSRLLPIDVDYDIDIDGLVDCGLLSEEDADEYADKSIEYLLDNEIIDPYEFGKVASDTVDINVSEDDIIKYLYSGNRDMFYDYFGD